MPHINVKLYPGKSDEQKTRLAEAISKNVIEILGSREESVSVAFEEIPSDEWAEKVFKPEIVGKQNHLYKKPGYSM